MKKNLHRLLCLLLALSIVLALAACTKTQTSEKPTEPSADPAAETNSGKPAEAAADPFGKYEEPITINVVRTMESTTKFDTNYPETYSLEDNVWSHAYEDMLGIKLNYLWTPPADSYATKWTTAMASGDLPDMGVVDAATYLTLVEAGLVEDMTDIFEQYASDYYKEQIAAENGISVDFMTFNGRMLGLPITGATPDAANFLFIRKDWLEKAGMDAPTTIDELIEVAKAFKAAQLGGPDTYGICMGPYEFSGQCDWEGFLNGYKAYYNIWVKTDDGKLAYSTIQPEMREALLGMQQLYKEGLISTEFAVNGNITEDLVSDKVGIAYGTYWAPIMAIQDEMNNNPDSKWMVLELPTIDGSKATTQAWGNGAPSSFFFVRKGYEHPEAAVKMLNLGFKLDTEEPMKYNFHEESQIQVHAYRIAGLWEPWRNVKNNELVWTALETGDTSALSENNMDMYTNICKYREGTLEREKIGYMLVNETTGSTYSIINQMNAEGRIILSAYKTLPSQEFTETLNLLDTEMMQVMTRVIAGEDISAYDRAVESWLANGGQELTDEVNAWYAGT